MQTWKLYRQHQHFYSNSGLSHKMEGFLLGEMHSPTNSVIGPNLFLIQTLFISRLHCSIDSCLHIASVSILEDCSNYHPR